MHIKIKTLGLWLAMMLCVSYGYVKYQRAKLPIPPKGFYPSEIARIASEIFIGNTITKVVRAGATYPDTVQVEDALLGAFKRGQKVSCVWEPGRPPLALKKPNDPWTEKVLCVFDNNKKLLLIAPDYTNWVRAVPGAIGASRYPSKHYSKRELDWAWHALKQHYNSDQFRDYVWDAWREDRLPLGLMELFLRFAGPEYKIELLKQMRSGRHLGPKELDIVHTCLWDLSPGVQHESARLLLKHKRALDPVPLWATLNKRNDNSQALRVLGPLVESGDKAARAELLNLLIQADASEYRVVEQAAYGTPDLLPLLKRFLNCGVGTSAWLQLGGSIKELPGLLGIDISMLPSSALSLVGNREAADLLLQRLAYDLKTRPEPEQYQIKEGLRYLDKIVRSLPTAERRFLVDAISPGFREGLSSIKRGEYKYYLSAILTRAGDEEAIRELAAASWKEAENGETLRDVADVMREIPDPIAVKILVALLLRAKAGWRYDCVFDASTTVAYITKILQKRSPKDRDLALALLGQHTSEPITPAHGLFYVRWALGELPAPSQLEQIIPNDIATACNLSLKDHRKNYSSILRTLRQDPRKHWFALTLLKDEASAQAFGEWLQEAAQEKNPMGYTALTAIRRMGSARATPYMYRSVANFHRSVEFYTTVGEIVDPNDLSELVSLCLKSDATTASFASHALLLALGRR